jgi:hypothetical protein
MVGKARSWAGVVAALACFELTACPGPTPLVPLAPDADGAVPTAPCEVACARMAALNCPEARPTPKGLTCVQVCAATPAYALDQGCVARATTLEALRACGVCE